MIKKLVERKRIRGGLIYGILSHGLRVRIGQGIHSNPKKATHFPSETRRRERIRHNLFCGGRRWEK